jgi:hypothetical protein
MPDVEDQLVADEPRGWDQLRADAVAAARAARARRTEDIVDIVLAVCDEETVRRLAAKLIADTGIRAMDFRRGASMDLEPARDAVALWVGIARGMLNGGPNYSETRVDYGLEDPPGVEMTVGLAEDPERFVFRLQRAGRLTPHEARREAEDRAASLEAELARFLPQEPAPQMPGGRGGVVYVWLCPSCGGYDALATPDDEGALSGGCQGCGERVREVHRFQALALTAANGGCTCPSAHRQVTGDLPDEAAVTAVSIEVRTRPALHPRQDHGSTGG